jgi:hypothetical protein
MKADIHTKTLFSRVATFFAFLFLIFHSLLAAHFQADEGIPFFIECQGCWCWWVLLTGDEDPPVIVECLEENAQILACERLSDFILRVHGTCLSRIGHLRFSWPVQKEIFANGSKNMYSPLDVRGRSDK